MKKTEERINNWICFGKYGESNFNIYSFEHKFLKYLVNFKDKSLPISDLQFLVLIQQRDYIEDILIDDCIELIGLHKILDFNNFTLNSKEYLYYLFTSKKSINYMIYESEINNRINKSIENNIFSLLNKKDIKQIILFTKYRQEHLKIINNLLNNWCNPHNYHIAKNEYLELCNTIPYDNPYPSLEWN